MSRRNISNKLSVEFTPGRIIRWRKLRFVVVDCTGFEAIIAREVGKRRLERIPVAEDGVLVEHWDVIQDEATREQSKSGNPMFGDTFPDRA